MEAHRTSKVEVAVTMTPDQAKVIAYCLTHAARDLETQDRFARDYALTARALAAEIGRALA